jgi:hypothetical protein
VLSVADKEEDVRDNLHHLLCLSCAPIRASTRLSSHHNIASPFVPEVLKSTTIFSVLFYTTFTSKPFKIVKNSKHKLYLFETQNPSLLLHFLVTWKVLEIVESEKENYYFFYEHRKRIYCCFIPVTMK